MRAIYGLYPNPDSAQRAMDILQRAERGLGFEDSQIVVLSGEPYEDYPFAQRDRKTVMPWLAALGGLAGAVLGFWFISFTQKAYPMVTGGMEIVTKLPDGIISYELTMLGAILTTFFTLLIAARIPDWRRHLHDPAISDGQILIGVVDPPERSRDELTRRLRSAGAADVKEFIR